jgi:hypothetical protein
LLPNSQALSANDHFIHKKQGRAEKQAVFLLNSGFVADVVLLDVEGGFQCGFPNWWRRDRFGHRLDEVGLIRAFSVKR